MAKSISSLGIKMSSKNQLFSEIYKKINYFVNFLYIIYSYVCFLVDARGAPKLVSVHIHTPTSHAHIIHHTQKTNTAPVPSPAPAIR